MEDISRLGLYGNAESGVSGFAGFGDWPSAAAALTKTAMERSIRFTLLIVNQFRKQGDPSREIDSDNVPQRYR